MVRATRNQNAIKKSFDLLLRDLTLELRAFYGQRLIAAVVFGSVGRGAPRSDSDLDLLIVADPLPSGRMRRSDEFNMVKKRLSERIEAMAKLGVFTRLSPIFKTPYEVRRGSLLFLDMIDDGRILMDPSRFWQGFMDDFQLRLKKLGARKIYEGDSWYWDLKPDYVPGEIFEI